MLYNIAILDNDTIFAKLLKESIDRITEELSIEFFSEHLECDCNKFDAFFIEIDLDHTKSKGFAVANQIKKLKNVPIIFITKHEAYAMDGYLNDAFALLLKAEMNNYIDAIVNKILSNLKNDTNHVIVEDKYDSKMKRLLCFDEIYCIYAQGNYILIRNKKNEFKKRTSVCKMMEYLSEDFFEISRGVVININKLKKIESDQGVVILENEDKLLSSKKRLITLISMLDRKFNK